MVSQYGDECKPVKLNFIETDPLILKFVIRSYFDYFCVMEMNSDNLDKAAFILKTIAHPIRLGIVELLGRNEKLSVNEISEGLNIEQSLTSHHLNNMKLKGVLGSERSGKNVYYSLRIRELLKVIDCIENCDPKIF